MYHRFRAVFFVYIAGLAFYAVTVPLLHVAILKRRGPLFAITADVLRQLGMAAAIVAAVLAAVSLLVVPQLLTPEWLARRPGLNRFEAVAQYLFRAQVVRLVCAEAVAMLGLLLYLASADLTDFYVFLLPALGMLAVLIPRPDRWVRLVAELRRLRGDWQGD
jgi:hypothetical protein